MSRFSDISFTFGDECNNNSEKLATLLKLNFENVLCKTGLWCSSIQEEELLHLITKKLNWNRICAMSMICYCDANTPFDYSYFHNVLSKFKQPSLIIFETNYGEIYGGFTSKAWLRVSPDQDFVKDPHAFLFSINRESDGPQTTTIDQAYASPESANIQIYGLASYQDKVALNILDDDQYGGIMFGRDCLFICNDCTNSKKSSTLFIDPQESTYYRGDDEIEIDFYIRRIAFYHVK